MPITKELEKVIKEINKKYGEGTITTASKALAVKIKRIPTGSFSLDVETGGGYPQGRITIITGHYSSGKSFLALKAVCEAQKIYPDKLAVWVDQEGSFDKEWAEVFGVNLDSLYVVRPPTAEAGFDIILSFLQHNDVSIIVLDSLAAMSSTREIEKSMEDSSLMGGNAKLNNEFFRKAQAILNMGSLEEEREQPVLIIINQLRDSMDPYKKEVMPGGRGQEFFASLIIQVRVGDRYVEKAEDGREIYVGHQLKFKVEKNKTFPPKRTGEFDLYVQTSKKGFKAGDIDRLKEVVKYAVYWDVIQKRGPWYTVMDNPDWKFQGGEAVLEFLRTNEDAMRAVEERVKAIALNTSRSSDKLLYETEDGITYDPETGEVIEDTTE